MSRKAMEPSMILKIKLEVEEDPLKAINLNENAKKNPLTITWTNYTWNCCHCYDVFKNLEDLRSHSKEKHSLCNALCCADCNETFSTFKNFVEHVRGHRDVLRNSCEYCNESFAEKRDCDEHLQDHYAGTCKICEMCGEILPYANTLEWHKQLYGPTELEPAPEGKSWANYDWICQECGMRYTALASLREHVQSSHDACFSFRCADCAQRMKSFKLFVSHVITHRPYLKSFCQYCNAHFTSFQGLNQHIVQHITSQQRPCNLCGQIFNDNSELAVHKKLFSSPGGPKRQYKAGSNSSSGSSTPKRRRKRAVFTVEDLTCKHCGKICDTITKYKRHIETHGNRRRDFVCPTCGRSFLTKGTMADHVKTHSQKTEVCKVCNKKFHTKWKLKNHITTHLTDKPFACSECGATFKTKRRLNSHQKKHSDVKPFKCPYCAKEFRFKENLKTHEHQHTGARPYSCEFCERTFTNWTNCNKHMLRKHGVTLARTKITEHGRLAINRTTGEVNQLNSDSKTKEWLDDMLKPAKRGGRKGSE